MTPDDIYHAYGPVALVTGASSGIGQAFADEVFRVFQQAHPGTKLLPINLTPEVGNMVKRATGRLE